jgi:ATP-dependent RNA helicase DeaD
LRRSDPVARPAVATGITARSIRVHGIDLVMHADLPTSRWPICTRSGRIGRAGASGVMITSRTSAQAVTCVR